MALYFVKHRTILPLLYLFKRFDVIRNEMHEGSNIMYSAL